MIKANLYIHYLGISLCLILLLLSTNLTHSEDQSQEKKNRIRLAIKKADWSPEGYLVLCVRIYAPESKGVDLFYRVPSQTPGEPDILEPFSLAKSYLVNGYTNTKIEPLSELPGTPYFGPLSSVSPLSKGGWTQLAVAFPHPPEPPVDENGHKKPYKLLFYAPLDADPIAIIPPPNPSK
jgi:hypothetical protein